MNNVNKTTSLLIILLATSLLFTAQSLQIQSSPLPKLHTEGKYVKDELGNVVLLRGCSVIEPEYMTDKLRHDQTVQERAKRLKELGVNFVRLQADYQKWSNNVDTDGDGVGNRDFTVQMAEALSNEGIYVCPGIMYGNPKPWVKEEWADWLINDFLEYFKHIPNLVGVFILNEPQPFYDSWGGTNLDGGLTSGYWEAAKYVCQQIHQQYPNLLIIVHADLWREWRFSNILKTDPIPTPNVVYTWHYYYNYGPALNPYLGGMTGVLDPTYQEFVNIEMPFYQSYYLGNFTKARAEFEQWLHDKYLWPTDFDLPIINDEFGFNENEQHYASRRYCTACGWTGDVVDTLDAPNGNKVTTPYPTVTYCPICGEALPQPREQFEPGWAQVMRDFIGIMEEYYCSWNYLAWWPKTYGGYGLTEDDMSTLSKVGEVFAQQLTAPFPSPEYSPPQDQDANQTQPEPIIPSIDMPEISVSGYTVIYMAIATSMGIVLVFRGKKRKKI